MIQDRLSEFKNIGENGSDNEIFVEFAFCILTPQSNAHKCWDAIETLRDKGMLFFGSRDSILKELMQVRFKYKKSKYLVYARERFLKDGKLVIRSILKENINTFVKRDWLTNNIKGMGYKEASHFLRNIGFGTNIAILDRHILRTLKSIKVIDEIPESLSRKKYLTIEEKMRSFARDIEIPMDHLDLLFWYRVKEEVFK